MNRILFEAAELSADGTVELRRNDERSRHIRTVLKAVEGQKLRSGVVNGEAATATVERIDERRILLRLARQHDGVLPPAPVSLILAHPRPIVLKRMLKDLTTLGAAEILILPGDLGERSYLESSLWEEQGYRRHLVDGAMQGGSTYLPEVRRFGGLTEALERVTGRLRLLADERAPATGSLEGVVASARAEQGHATLAPAATGAVGPERGWSDRERDLFRQAGFTAVRLGARTLRSETAATVMTMALVGLYVR
ncbi:MAG: 16S rRNA (uracil(1498)-N(3))-methyltransferase [Alkalispirochaetaceae bacterium]